MKLLLIIGTIAFFMTTTPEKYDFGTSKAGSDWQVVNDNVMGGRSASTKTLTKNSLQFEGNVSLENNGGFASLRSPWGKFDYSNYTKMTMRFKGTNRKFAVTMATSPRFYEPNFKYFFEPNPDEWQTLTFNLEDFKTHQMGRSTGEKITNDDLSKIIRLGIILYDKKAGDFELEIDYIKFK